MAIVNQQGQPVQENVVLFSDLTLEERKFIMDKLLDFMGIEIIRTNATKHGNTELQVQVQAP